MHLTDECVLHYHMAMIKCLCSNMYFVFHDWDWKIGRDWLKSIPHIYGIIIIGNIHARVVDQIGIGVTGMSIRRH